VEGKGDGVNRQSLNRRLSIALGKHAMFYQAKLYAKLACVHELETQDRPEKYVSICSDSQAALKGLQAAKTTSPLVRQCQQALNDSSTRHAMGLYWVPGHAGLRGNKIADKLANSVGVQRFVEPESFLGGSRLYIRRKMKRWLEKHYLSVWRGPCSKQREARKLISGPDLATGVRLLACNRTRFKIVVGLLTRH
jgi:hypothetical protein